MIQHFLSLFDAPLTYISLAIPPFNDLIASSSLKPYFTAPLPFHIWRARVVGERPHRMHSTHLWPPVSRTHSSARRAPKFRKQRVQDPGVAPIDLGENVDVHFLEHVQGRKDIVVEGKGQVAGCSKRAGGGGMGVCEVGGDEIAPEKFGLWKIKGVSVLREGEGEGPSEEKKVEGICGGRGGGVAG